MKRTRIYAGTPKLFDVDLTQRRARKPPTHVPGSRLPTMVRDAHTGELPRKPLVYAEVKDSPSPYPTSSYERAASYRRELLYPSACQPLNYTAPSRCQAVYVLLAITRREKLVSSPSGIRRRRISVLPWDCVPLMRGWLVNQIVGCVCALKCVCKANYQADDECNVGEFNLLGR